MVSSLFEGTCLHISVVQLFLRLSNESLHLKGSKSYLKSGFKPRLPRWSVSALTTELLGQNRQSQTTQTATRCVQEDWQPAHGQISSESKLLQIYQ